MRVHLCRPRGPGEEAVPRAGIINAVLLGLGALTVAGLASLLVFGGTLGADGTGWLSYGILALIPAFFLSLSMLLMIRWRGWLAQKEAYDQRQEAGP